MHQPPGSYSAATGDGLMRPSLRNPLYLHESISVIPHYVVLMSHCSDTRCTMYRSQHGYENVWLIIRPDASPAPGAPLPLSGPVVGTARNSTGISTVTGIDEILSFRSSVGLRANGSGFTRGARCSCQGLLEADAEADGCVDDDDDDAAAAEEDEDDEDAVALRSGFGASAHISSKASLFVCCRQSTPWRSAPADTVSKNFQ